jgi:hypothetical protein
VLVNLSNDDAQSNDGPISKHWKRWQWCLLIPWQMINQIMSSLNTDNVTNQLINQMKFKKEN